MFVFQTGPASVSLNLVDRPDQRKKAWVIFWAASQSNDQVKLLTASKDLARLYMIVDPRSDLAPNQTKSALVGDMFHFVEYLYGAPDFNGNYRQQVKDVRTIYGLIGAAILGSVNCPDILGQLIGDRTTMPPVNGKLREISSKLANPDSKKLNEQTTMLEYSIACATVKAIDELVKSTKTKKLTEEQKLSLSILISSLDTRRLFEIDKNLDVESNFDPFPSLVGSMCTLLKSKDLTLVSSAAALLSHLDYDVMGRNLKPGVKRDLEDAINPPASKSASTFKLDPQTLITLQWALMESPAHFNKLASPTNMPPLPLHVSEAQGYRFNDLMYSLFNSSGKYPAIAYLDPQPIFHVLPLASSDIRADIPKCRKYFEGLKVYFNDPKNLSKVTTAENGLVEGQSLSQADFALTSLIGIAESLSMDPREDARKLGFDIYQYSIGKLANIAKKARTDFEYLGRFTMKKRFSAAADIGKGFVHTAGLFQGNGTVRSNIFQTTVPFIDPFKVNQNAEQDDNVVFQQPLNSLSNYIDPADNAGCIKDFKDFGLALNDYLRNTTPNNTDYIPAGDAFVRLITNAGRSQFKDGNAGKDEAIRLAESGDLRGAIDQLGPNSKLLKDLIERGLLTETRAMMLSQPGFFSLRWTNPIAWTDMNNFLGSYDTRNKFAYFPIYLEVADRNLVGGVVETHLVWDVDKKDFVEQPRVLWKDHGKQYSLNMYGALILPREQLKALSSWGVGASTTFGENLATKKTEWAESSFTLGRLGSVYGPSVTQEALDVSLGATFRKGGNNIFNAGAGFYFDVGNLPLAGYVFNIAKPGIEVRAGPKQQPEINLNFVLVTKPVADLFDAQFMLNSGWNSALQPGFGINEAQMALRYVGNDAFDLAVRGGYRPIDEQTKATHQILFGTTPKDYWFRVEVNLKGLLSAGGIHQH